MKLDEPKVVELVRKHLKHKGWTLGQKKEAHAPGADIVARKRAGRQYRYLIIDAKGEMKTPPQRSYGLRTLIGQIATRMWKIKRYPYFWMYGIALPESYQSVLGKIANDMRDMWWVMKLRVYLVGSHGRVEERNWKDFLRE